MTCPPPPPMNPATIHIHESKQCLKASFGVVFVFFFLLFILFVFQLATLPWPPSYTVPRVCLSTATQPIHFDRLHSLSAPHPLTLIFDAMESFSTCHQLPILNATQMPHYHSTWIWMYIWVIVHMFNLKHMYECLYMHCKLFILSFFSNTFWIYIWLIIHMFDSKCM